MCGTCRLNYLDNVNKANVKDAIALLENSARLVFYVVQVLCTSVQPNTPSRSRRRQQQAVCELDPMRNAAFVVWKDFKDDIFFTNDWEDTPSTLLESGYTQEMKNLVRGIILVQRWISDEQCHRSSVRVPATVAA